MLLVEGVRSYMSGSDHALLERWLTNRDAEAFREIVDRYAGMVYGTCTRILRNPDDAEDVAQECFLQLACADSGGSESG